MFCEAKLPPLPLAGEWLSPKAAGSEATGGPRAVERAAFLVAVDCHGGSRPHQRELVHERSPKGELVHTFSPQ